MVSSKPVTDTKPLLRQRQIVEFEEDQRDLEAKLKNPHIQDKGAVAKSLRKLKHQLEAQTPQPFAGAEKDVAVKREKELAEAIQEGMPTAREMRRSPPGMINRHLEWERKNKERILEWKNLRLRNNPGSDDPDLANIETLRRTHGGAGEANMDNTIVPGKNFYFPSGPIEAKNVMSDEDRERLEKELDDLKKQIAEIRGGGSKVSQFKNKVG